MLCIATFREREEAKEMASPPKWVNTEYSINLQIIICVIGKKQRMKKRDCHQIDQEDETGQSHQTEEDQDHLVEGQEIETVQNLLVDDQEIEMVHGHLVDDQKNVTVEGVLEKDVGHIHEKEMDIDIIEVDREIEKVTINEQVMIDILEEIEAVQGLLIDDTKNIVNYYTCQQVSV